MHFLSITSSKSAPKLRRFQHFDLENLLFDRPEPQNIGKTLENTVRNSKTLEKRSVWECSTSSRAWIFFLLTRSSLTLPKTVAAFVHKSGVWLLNFLVSFIRELHRVCCMFVAESMHVIGIFSLILIEGLQLQYKGAATGHQRCLGALAHGATWRQKWCDMSSMTRKSTSLLSVWSSISFSLGRSAFSAVHDVDCRFLSLILLFNYICSISFIL